MQSSANPPKVRRRNRIITSCLECRRRKLKCDRLHPCNHCAKAARDCVFLSPALDSASKGKLNQFKESIDNLEKGLERHAEGSSLLAWNVSSPAPSGSSVRQSSALSAAHLQPREPIPEDEQNLEPSPLAILDVTYDDDGDDLMDDIGVKLGKMRISERLGGYVRPKFAEEFAESLRDNTEAQMNASKLASSSWSQANESNLSYLEPGPEYMPPGENLMFPSTASEDMSLISFLPSRDFSDRLIHQYWTAVHPIARVVHKPSFERQYNQFWQDVAQGFEPLSPLQALVFAAMFSAAVSLSDDTTESEFGCPRQDMIRTLRAGCEHALSKSRLLRTTKVMTIQACVMYLLPICREEVTRGHAALVSMVIRLAECSGLHRDGTTFGLSPVDTHVRRLVWYQLCFLDIRTCESAGPRPYIRKEDFDTRLPLNVNESEIESLVPPKQDAARFTDMTVPRIRMECYEVFRAIWFGRPLVETGKMALTSLVRKVEEFREYGLQKFMPLIDKSIPIQNYGAKLLQLLTYKMHTAVLHRYVASVPQSMPERLMQVVWSSSIGFIDIAVEMETSPTLRPYLWYIGATVQYHMALLLLYLIWMYPDHPEADRIWAGLDFVFEFPKNLSRGEKIILAFSLASQRLDEHQRQKKQRLPTSVESFGSQKSASPPQRQNSSGPSLQRLYGLSTANTDSYYSAESMSGPPPSDQPWLFPSPSTSEVMSYSSGSSSQVPAQPTGAATQSPSSGTYDFPQAASIARDPNPGLQYSTAAPAHTGLQGLDDLDWDEINRLFPQDAPMLSFDPVPPTQPRFSTAGIPAMTYFPTNFMRPLDRRGQ